jgi:hypothetical protein
MSAMVQGITEEATITCSICELEKPWKEAEKFRVGSEVRLLERRALALEKYIASISLVSILFAILIQEITFNGSYSNEYGGDWFSKKQQAPIPASKMIATEDSPIVTMMKFFLTKLTIVQLCMMITQFRIVTRIMIEQKQLDLILQEWTDLDVPRVTLTGSFGYSSSHLLQLKYCIELAVCAIHPMPFVKQKFVTKIVGRDAIYSVESMVTDEFLSICSIEKLRFFSLAADVGCSCQILSYLATLESTINELQTNLLRSCVSCLSSLQLWMFQKYLGRDSALAGEEVRRLLNKVLIRAC